jgi:protein-disulfide isomerase
MLVDKYLNSIKDDRKEYITYVDLEDVGSTPSQENIELARKYGVTATPVVVAVDDDEFETYVGGVQITQNIRKIYDKYIK